MKPDQSTLKIREKKFQHERQLVRQNFNHHTPYAILETNSKANKVSETKPL